MDDIEKLTELIGVIYDAALDPNAWNAALASCAQFVDGSAATLFSKDANSRNGDVAFDVGIDSHYKKLYFERYIRLDPLTTGQFFAEIDVPVSTTDLVPYEEFMETRFYGEWVKPQRLVDFVTTQLDKSETSAAMFGVFRHERNTLADDAMRVAVVEVGGAPEVAAFRKTEADTFADTLDGLNTGVFFVASCGRIAHANKAGAAMLSAGKVVCSNRDRLMASNAQCNKALTEAIAAAGKSDIALSPKGISMPLVARDGENHVAHVLPLTSGERQRASASFAATAAVFVHAAAFKPTAAPEVIAKTFKLTPTELRTFLAVVEIGGVPEVAEELGISSNTVKTHLQRIFSKTGANRQADLVKLFAGFVSPFAG